MKRTWIPIFAVSLLASAASAELVVQRWGNCKYVQHADTLKVSAGKDSGTVLTFDVSALPKGAKIARARLLLWSGEGYEAEADGKKLQLVEPYARWFDATPAVAAQAASGKVVITLTSQYGFKPDQCALEVAYEGKPPKLEGFDEKALLAKQVSELKAHPHAGQVLLTFKEIWDIAEGDANVTWGAMVTRVKTCTPQGLVPKDEPFEVRYHVYRSDKPITAENLPEAEFLHEIIPGSVYIDEAVARGKVGEQGPTFLKEGQALLRVRIGLGDALPPGTGFYPHTVRKAGKVWYAVTAVVNGLANTTDISDANVVGPIEQKVATPEPILYAEQTKEVKKPEGAVAKQQWYTWWLAGEMTPYPKRYDVVLDFCEATMAKPAPLEITRGHAWISTPEPPSPGSPRADVVLSHCSDNPNGFWMGLPNRYNNLRGMRQAIWRPWPQERTHFLIKWIKGKFPIDDQRIVGSIGCWGLMELEQGDIYAFLHGWGEPEVTKGFQCWGRAGVWGRPTDYAGVDNQWNPFHRQDYSRWVLDHPEAETPYFQLHTGWGAHFGEMGWPPFPRFLRAMIDTRHPFTFQYKGKRGLPAMKKDQTVPAFGNCTLDDNPGNGDARNGETFGAQVNGYLTWDIDTLVDEPAKWEMTVILEDNAPLAECRVDLTPRRVQRFKAKEGESFKWTVTQILAPAKDEQPAAGKRLGSGTAKADKYGLVTCEQIPLFKGANRVVIEKQ